jgi:hypothetical protein
MPRGQRQHSQHWHTIPHLLNFHLMIPPAKCTYCPVPDQEAPKRNRKFGGTDKGLPLPLTFPPIRLRLCYLKVSLRRPRVNIQQTYALSSQLLILECSSRHLIPLILTHLWTEEGAKGGRGQLEEMDRMGLTHRKKP